MSIEELSFKNSIKDDLPASLVVFLVAVPLCLGIALASGAPPFAGLIAGIVGGIIVGFFSGSALGVSGPAAGLTVIVLSAINDLGSYESFLLAVVLSGALQLVLGFARAGIIGYYFPTSVIKGMLSAIGIIIFLKQIPHALGYDKDYEGDISFVQGDGHNTFSELYYMLDSLTMGPIVITIISLAILILWESKFIKRHKIFNIIQGPLIVVVLGIISYNIFPSIGLQFLPDHAVSIPVADSFSGFISNFTTPDFGLIGDSNIWLIAITMALVASLETLLCVEATDKLDPYKRITPTDKELKAQGIGNIVSGLIGGLPVTQVIVRSSANIQSGGKTKTSAIFHGVLILISAALIPTLLNQIPLASLAAILLMVGYKLAKPALFKAMYKLGGMQFIPFIATVIGIVFTDLLIGIGIGLGVAVFYILYTNFKTPYHFIINGDKDFTIELSEDVTFLNKASIMNTLKSVPDGSRVIINESKVVNIDFDVIEIIDDFKTNAKLRDINLVVIGEKRSGENQFQKFNADLKNSENIEQD